jgi:predicted O-methyltransferase YrrM
MIRALFASMGLNVIKRRDYSSTLPNLDELKENQARWDRPSALSGLRFDLESMRSDLSRLHRRWGDEFDRETGPFETNRERGFGPGLPRFDARLLYYLMREWKPLHYLEIGSGLSTYYASLAARVNEGENRPMRLYCVEPYPYPELANIAGIEIRRDFAQNIPLSAFRELEEGDVLFIDSSHALRIDSDVSWLLLEALPSLRPGVIVHFHDIPFPYNTPYPAETWIFGDRWPSYWNEAMVVQAFLAFNSDFEIVMSAPLLRHADEAYFLSTFADYTPLIRESNPFSSLWIRRVR